jgi:two-component system nitrogen regulation sensor histidine kinase NtrY
MNPGSSPADTRAASGGAPAPAARALRLLPWVGLVLLALWTGRPSPWWLVGASAALVGSVALGVVRDRVRALGVILLLAAVVAGFAAHARLVGLGRDFEAYWTLREERVAALLEGELDALIDAGDAAAREVAALAGVGDADARYRRLIEARESTGFTAMALYDSAGRLDVWDGAHQGVVPDPVRLGAVPYAYADRPLFSHLYFTAPAVGGRGTAVVAALLKSDLPEALGARADDFAARVRARTGEEIRISRAELAAGEGIWDLELGDRTLFSVEIARPSAADRIDRVRERWAAIVGAVLIAAWVALALSGRGQVVEGAASAGALAALGVLLPLGGVLRSPGLFSPGDFLLPGPVGLSLGQVMVVAFAGALAAGLAGSPRTRLPLWAAAALVALSFPALIGLMRAGASPGFLSGRETGWVAYELVLALALSIPVAVALRLADPGRRPLRAGWVLVAAALVALLLTGGALVIARGGPRLPLWLAALWAVPAGLAAWALARWHGWERDLIGWSTAVLLGTTAALPFAWTGRLESRMTVAERQLERLGGRVDPYLQFLLGRFAEVADSIDRRGAGPAEVLYGAWSQSGLAEEGYPVWLTYWSGGGLPEEELRIGVGAVRPALADDFLPAARSTGTPSVRRLDQADAHYVAAVPLGDGGVVTAVVPPLRELRFSSPLGPLFDPEASTEPEPLTLVPLSPSDPRGAGQALRWVRTGRGWQGEMLLSYPDALFHAHYRVERDARVLLAARGTLLLALNLLVFLLLWAIGRLLGQGGGPPWTEWKGLFASFRARVTLALFGFFVLALAICGTLAYRTIAGASERTAEVLAERIAQDAAGFYLEVQGEMDLLARRVGADLLEFREGALLDASVEELVEIGLYEGWIPYPQYRQLSTREELLDTRAAALGSWEYALAYRTLPDGDILGTLVPLQEGAAAVRRRDVAQLIAFAVLVGAGLSLALALLVGRALTRPIQLLRIASERVGSGNLGVRLAGGRPDEFGSVFEAFNRMVGRLRRARRALVRTTRRTQAIVEESATGLIAFGPDAEVTLVNEPAEAFLGREVPVGVPLDERGDPADEVAAWVRMYFRDALRAAGSEFQLGSRRVRVRARRIDRRGTPRNMLSGAVMSVEDITDELRAERVLAWGEMARQVAHEVKNPLTPIKLSIQHIRRAWDDRRADFGDILSRNAGAILGEIDRLASIASSFSRLGTPAAAGGPLEAVSLDRVVEDVLTLYASGGGKVRFERDVEPGLPAVTAREPEVKEVLVNLLENARAAIREEGTVRVEVAANGAGLEMRVRDDGGGIPPELVNRVFEPHFSTRSSGTGLGLAIVKRLVESWGGGVVIESEPGRGTTVTVRLKRWQDGGSGSLTVPSS